MQPDVVDPGRLDRRQRLGDAVDERLAADEPERRIGLRDMRQMLAAAEADLEPERPAVGEERLERERPPLRVLGGRDAGEPQPRQELGEQPLLARLQPLAVPAPVELAPGARALRAGAHTARRSASPRSVRSQEKPPSLSGARPKCP